MAGEAITTVIGNLVADPESRQVGAHTVVGLTIAVTGRQYKDGEWVDGESTFFRCSAWREVGQHAAQSLSKGMRVIATGKLQQRNWEKDGQKRSAIELEIDEIGPSLRYATASVQRAQSNGNQAARAVQARGQGGPANVQQRQQQQAAIPYDEDIPF